ncbi:MAG: hypothetical protein ACMG6E_08605 [Candidatus Roizmanbacteria bacterium]
MSNLGVSFEQNVEMVKLLNYGIVWQTIQKGELLGLVNDTSDFLKIELNRVKAEKGFIANVRGQGTFLGFDVVSKEIADNL